MPWCERCDRFLNPNTVLADGTCPSCGRFVEAPPSAGPARGAGSGAGTDELPVDTEAEDDFKAPWHFWVMIAAAAIYLGWRFLEGIWWVIRQVV